MTASPAEDQALAAVELIRAGRFEELQRQFLPMLHGVISAAGLRDGWQAKVTRYGELRTVGTATIAPARQNMTVARIGLGFERGAVTLVISMLDGRLVNIAIEDGAA